MNDNIKTDEFLEYLSRNKDRVWIFIDTETLGFNPNKHQMTEVAATAVSFDGTKFRELSSYHEKAKLLSITRIRMSYPYRGSGLSYRDLMQMTNYGEKTPRGYIEEHIILGEMYDFLHQFDDPILVAHNSPFDIKYLNTRHNVYYENKSPYDNYEVLDTLKVMKKYFTALVATEAKRYKHRWLTKEESQHILEMRSIRKSLQKKKNKRMSLKLGNVADSLGINTDGWHSAKFDVEALISTTEKIFELFKDNSGKNLHPEKYYL